MIELSTGWQVCIEPRDYQDHFALVIYRKMKNGKTHVLNKDMTTIETISENMPIDPNKCEIKLSPEILQALCDSLDEFGIHPKSRRYKKEVDLMKYHLEDMRRLVFRKGKL